MDTIFVDKLLEIFAKLCALIRISVPYTGMIISTRESKAVREKVIRLGVSQISGASRTSVGGYAFYGCTALKTAILPETVASIGNYAFFGNTVISTYKQTTV